MKLRLVVTFPIALALSCLVSGCDTANEDALPKTKQVDDGTPVFKSYGERQQWEAEQRAKKAAEKAPAKKKK